MKRLLKLLLIIESVVILACCPCGTYCISALSAKPEFMMIYHAVCTTVLLASILFVVTVVTQELRFKDNPPSIRLARIGGAFFMVLFAINLSGWLFNPATTQEAVQRAGYMNLGVWLGFLPMSLLAALFFKAPPAKNTDTPAP